MMAGSSPPASRDVAGLDTALAALDAALAALVPESARAHVRAGVRAIDLADEAGLHEVEHRLVASAGALRRAEFATGRRLLRELLGRDVAIGADERRIPVLPPGWTGTLSHDRQVAVALVAPRALGTWGVDVEPWQALPSDVDVEVRRADDAPVDTCTLFVAKEAAYKAWSDAGGPPLVHHDVRVRIGDGDGDGDGEVALVAELSTDPTRVRLPVPVRVCRVAGWVVALAGPLASGVAEGPTPPGAPAEPGAR